MLKRIRNYLRHKRLRQKAYDQAFVSFAIYLKSTDDVANRLAMQRMNPYKPETQHMEYTAWNRGWDDATDALVETMEAIL